MGWSRTRECSLTPPTFNFPKGTHPWTPLLFRRYQPTRGVSFFLFTHDVRIKCIIRKLGKVRPDCLSVSLTVGIQPASVPGSHELTRDPAMHPKGRQPNILGVGGSPTHPGGVTLESVILGSFIYICWYLQFYVYYTSDLKDRHIITTELKHVHINRWSCILAGERRNTASWDIEDTIKYIGVGPGGWVGPPRERGWEQD